MTEFSLALYVRSSKKAIGLEETGAWGYTSTPSDRRWTHIIRDYKVQTRTQYEYVSANEQRKAVSIVESLAREYGFKLRIIDPCQT